VPCRGRVALDGVAVQHLATERRVGLGMALVSERRDLFGSLSVADTCCSAPMPGRREAGALSAPRAIVSTRPSRACRAPVAERAHLVRGERQMLALGARLMSRPVLLLLDERASARAAVVCQIFDAIVQLKAAGVRSARRAEREAAFAVADEACVLERGVIRLRGRLRRGGRSTCGRQLPAATSAMPIFAARARLRGVPMTPQIPHRRRTTAAAFRRALRTRWRCASSRPRRLFHPTLAPDAVITPSRPADVRRHVRVCHALACR